MVPSRKGIQVEAAEYTSIKDHLLVRLYQGEKGIHVANLRKSMSTKF